jgi:hypothetical protein
VVLVVLFWLFVIAVFIIAASFVVLDPVSSSCVTPSLFCLSRQKQDDHKPKKQDETQ